MTKMSLTSFQHVSWNDLSQAAIDRCIDAFRKRLHAVIRVNGGHIEHFV